MVVTNHIIEYSTLLLLPSHTTWFCFGVVRVFFPTHLCILAHSLYIPRSTALFMLDHIQKWRMNSEKKKLHALASLRAFRRKSSCARLPNGTWGAPGQKSLRSPSICPFPCPYPFPCLSLFLFLLPIC